MGLLGNSSRLNFGCGHYMGCTNLYYTTGNREKASYFRTAMSREMASTILAYLANPVGSNDRSAFQQARVGGQAALRITSKGSLSANSIPEKTMTINLTGFGDLSAEGSLVISALCNMIGSGTLTADITGIFNASIDFSGDGTLSADIVGIAQAIVDMIGSGELSADIVGVASPTIDIVVTGTGLTTANVGNAVWSALAAANNDPNTMGEKLNDAGSAANPWTEVIEGTYTAADIMRLLSAVAAGKTTIVDLGGGLATVTFRDINDTVDRVIADMTNSERTDVTKNL